MRQAGADVYLLMDEITARCLAAGHVTARLQVEAERAVRELVRRRLVDDRPDIGDTQWRCEGDRLTVWVTCAI